MRKSGRPNKSLAELRIKNVMVAFNVAEWEHLNSLMQDAGISSPAIFLRAAGLKAKLPSKVFIPEIHLTLQTKIIEGVKSIRDMSNRGVMDIYHAGEFLANLRFIANELVNTANRDTVESLKAKIVELKSINKLKEAGRDH